MYMSQVTNFCEFDFKACSLKKFVLFCRCLVSSDIPNVML